MADSEVVNTVRDGFFCNAVVQGHTITLALPEASPSALRGLPMGSPSFTGRDDLLAQLTAALDPAHRAEVVLVSAVAGLGGVGKTEAVVQAARRACLRPGWFPGGVLFVDLFGYDNDRRVAPEDALQNLLGALGVSADVIPPGLSERALLYRSVLAAYADRGQRILVVLDNASSAEQVRPLLPGDGQCRTLVTSRHTLDIGARLHDLDVLSPDDAVELLRRTLRQARGADDARVDDAPEAALEIAALCGYLPLALDIAAAHLADIPARPLSTMAQALREAPRLDVLSRENRAVRTVFELSYRHLNTASGTLLRRLSLNPGPDVSTECAAVLAGIGAGEAERLLLGLTRAHLVSSGPTWGRWRMHDLVRSYAEGLAAADAASGEAHDRLLEHYVERAECADTYVMESAGVRPHGFAGRSAAVAWLEAERENLLGAVRQAAECGRADVAVGLVIALDAFQGFYGYNKDAVDSAQVAAEAARRAGDLVGFGRCSRRVAFACHATAEYDRGMAAAREAMDVARSIGDGPGEGLACRALADLLAKLDGKTDEALEAYRRSVALLGAADLDASDLGILTNRHFLGCSLLNLGTCLHDADRFDEAVVALEEAGEHLVLTNRSVAGLAHANLSNALREVGRVDESIAALRKAVEEFDGADDRWSLEMAVGAHHNLAMSLDGTAESVQVLGASAALCARLNDRPKEAAELFFQSSLLMDQNRPADALPVLERVLRLLRDLVADRPGEFEEDLREAETAHQEVLLALDATEAS
ncbi:ATP-binding protein [Streptomyces sp. NPDC050400]|uniref:ATP-binding protein n=1 Tax=Streptomyces sp. NPDC050400 TaxID=3365610 RepID=UPI0037BDC8A2